MNRLYPFVPLMPGESVTSFCARLATIHGVPSVFNFLRYLGLRFSRIAAGDPEAIAQLAALTGVAHDDLVRHSIRRQAGSYSYRGETVPRLMVRRGLSHICPRCLMEDIANSRRPAIASCYGRVIWEFESIRACARHSVLLEPLAQDRNRVTAYDFARAIWQTLPSLAQRAQDAHEVSASAAEAYLTDRLGERTKRSPLLDQMPWYAAARACEAVGAAALLGPAVALGNLAPCERREAADVGFQIIHGGEPAVSHFLDDLIRKHYTRDGPNDGSGALYGILHHILTRPSVDPAYAPLRGIVFRHALDAAPFGPGDIVVGLPVAQRRTHSLMTAAAEAGQHPHRLRKILVAEGIIPPDTALNGDVIFSAAIAAPVLRRATKLLNLRAMAEHLHTTYSYAKMLTTHGFIEPFKSDMVGEKVIRARFAKADVDAFMERLVEGVVVHPRPKRPLLDIPRAAKRTYCPMPDIIRMILDRQIRWVGVDPDKTGFHAILVNADEILERVRRPDHDGYTMQTLRVRMKVGQRVVQALIADGYLSQVMRPNPVNRHPDWIVLPETIDAFERTYVALSELARRWEVHANVIKNDLDRRGVKPAMKRDHVGATFYLRDSLL